MTLEHQGAETARTRGLLGYFGLLGAVAFLLFAGSASVLARFGQPLTLMPLATVPHPELPQWDQGQLKTRAARAQAQLERVKPQGLYLVVDTYRNRLRVVEDGRVVREALCSTGTGIVLIDPRNQRKWVFDTPLGERVIERKQRNPVWIKPDWAFIEEGEEPPKDPAERVDPYSLGDYGLYMGDGYIIHGTLFKSLLGRRVTHGCIRLGDEDLEFLYHNVPVGTRVYLY
ncbi:MAG: L,D-transpeptidase [Thermoanaerobaculum sp.]|nr:L,D-transpeptidase [Thermoanaerobaculum sp.]MDW7967779.1 L,D-transpeptidase [Thermoanaerobaculum sp.]